MQKRSARSCILQSKEEILIVNLLAMVRICTLGTLIALRAPKLRADLCESAFNGKLDEIGAFLLRVIRSTC
jgi:hypothetical protein